MTGFLHKRSFLFGAAYYAIGSFAIILAATPLFRVLGFEYSGVVSLIASIHLLYYTSGETRKYFGNNSWQVFKKIWFEIFLLSNIPLIISIISSLVIPNCSLWDGFIFYIEIVYPTALIAMLSGIFFGMSKSSKIRLNIYLALFWIFTLIISLLPGYFTGKIFTYGWQYGYFPGFVWDEAMELSRAYWESRVVELAIILLLMFLGSSDKNTLRENKKNIWERVVLSLTITLLAGVIGKQFSSEGMNAFLSKEEIIADTHIHYSPGSLTRDEMSLIRHRIWGFENEIDSIYGLRLYNRDTVFRKLTHVVINIYIFPNADDLYEYVGTREASITKPWKHSIYIAKPNLRSLKHELVHAILADHGSFPFDISWSTGLTEGAAVAMEDDYDGIRDCDEMSSRILQMKLASGIADVMEPSGFLSSASAQSYELSGSFSKYLLNRFGAEKYLQVYKETDFKEIYSRSLPDLESDWKNSLIKYQTPMDHYDSLRTMFYFKRTSILREPCLRRIGKLLKNANEAFKEKDYKLADSLYGITITETGRLSAIRGRVLSQLHLNNPQAAWAILDTTASAKETNNLSALRMMRGDVIALATSDIQSASNEWDEAMKLELGDNYFLGAFMRKYFLADLHNISKVQRVLRDLYGLEEVQNKNDLVFGNDSSEHEPVFLKARLFLYIAYLERKALPKQAYQAWTKASIPMSESKMPGEELFDTLMARKFSHYKEVFNDSQ